MNKLLIYAPKSGNRLIYVLDWLFGEQLKISYRLIHDIESALPENVLFSYGRVFPGAVSIPDAGLLWENNIGPCSPETGKWEEVPTLFATGINEYGLPFDLFSAIFFLLSRYEEYLAFTPDNHGRYPATDSILFREGLLERPVMDEWVANLRLLLVQKYSLDLPIPTFRFRPTYDIDIAWSYKHKGFYRTLGATAKSLLSGRLAEVATRFAVLSDKERDPYDSFEWLRQLHKKFRLHPVYFVLASMQTTPFDKNVHPQQPQMQLLIKTLAQEGAVGVHPSYFSNTKLQLLEEEKGVLENITGKRVALSRQHYIRLKLPDTCRQLIAAGITDDFSMGYGTHLGFRAGTGQSFYWFDLQAGNQVQLRIHPFCFMDTTAHFDCKLGADAAFRKLERMAHCLKDAGSNLTTVFHNFSLGKDPQWQQWNEAYAAFLENTIS